MYLHFLLLMDGMVSVAVYMFTRDVHVASETEPSGQFVSTYNPCQNCWDNSRFSPSPHYNVDFSRSLKSRLVHRSLACFNIVWGKGGTKKAAKEEHALSI